MKSFSWAVVCLLFPFYSYSQSTINGQVTDKSTKPIAYANVVVLNSSTGTNADSNGHFALTIQKGTYQILFSAVGYASQVKSITVSDIQTEINISLDDATQTLNEVIVTANKREEDIVKVSTSITSLSTKKIEDTRTWSLAGLTALVPNYNYQELGLASQQIQSIRGIQVFSENPAVATYIDDVNNLDILANGFAFTDIERIEVLRGPQGTLFGRNAMGGVVNIITNKPTNKASGFAEASIGNLGLQRYGFGVKAPIIKDIHPGKV